MRGVKSLGVLLRHVAVLAPLFFALSPLHAHGEERLRAGAPVVDTVRTQVTAAIAGILTSNCIAPDAPRPYDLTYLGLPAGDPHVSESLRSRINGALQEAIRGSGLAINVNAAENARALLPILGFDAESGRQLEQMVNRLYASTFAVAVQVSRPNVDVSRLTIAIFARSEGGSYSCNRTVGINLHMPSFTVIGDFRSSSADLVELSGAYQAVLAAVAPKLSTATSLTFRPNVHVDGNCGLSERAADTFTTAYFEMQQGELAAWLDGKSLPSLMIGSGDEKTEGVVMDVDYRLPATDGRTVDLTITIRTGNTVLARRQALAVADPGMLDGCRPETVVEATAAAAPPAVTSAPPAAAPAGAKAAPETGPTPVNPGSSDRPVATTEGGSAVAEESTGADDGRPPQRHLFVIANHDYRYAEDVRFAGNDASAVEKLFVEQFGLAPANITRYEDLTKGELEYLFGDADKPGTIGNQISSPDAEVYVYFVGHGSRSFMGGSNDRTPYLLGIDSRPDRLDLTGYDLNTLIGQLAAMREKAFPRGRVVVMLESCFSGRSDAGDLVTGVSAPTSGEAPVLKAEKGVTLIAAAHSDQVAVWDPEYRHGIFTDALVSALYGEADETRFGGNGDGRVTVAELESFLDNRMSRRIKQLRPEFRQTPEIDGAAASSVIFTLPDDGVGREEATEREHYELLTAREILESKDLGGVQPYLRGCVYCPLKDELRDLAQTERRREAICRAEERHAAELLKKGSALEIGAYLQRCECCGNREPLEKRVAELKQPDPAALKDEALWAAAERDATLDAFWYYVQNCEECTRKRDGEKKVAGICQRAHETVDAQFPADRSYDGLLRYLASCNDLPPVCGSCRKMGEAIKLVSEIESRPDFAAPAVASQPVGGAPERAVAAESEDLKAYKTAMASTEPADYDAFLARFPTSVYGPEIKERLTSLLAQEATWEEVSNAHTVEAYRRYVLQYPSGKHLREARDRIEMLQDETDWQRVLVERSRDALAEYLRKRPTGRYADHARQLVREFDEKG
ncbi:caspase family protein [Jiella avicenniae]|uniref:Caspase family protein n=1 Tax=Jiella avicenniae TaxID=2907202 RepID=A0A9X1T6H1_9HYPH|nr:caspase family protein [Jiella avicenniae]MCE7030207.1 caspase family protein [Jiella avicenniae]